MAQHIYDALEEFDSLESIRAILVDNTYVNTGWKNGLVDILEDKLGRNLHTVGCALHQNKTAFSCHIQKIGWSNMTVEFQRTTCKKCKEKVHSKPQIAFESIENPLQHSVKKDSSNSSTEQRLLYDYTKEIGSGKVGEKYSFWKIGQLYHARWRTLAMRLLADYTREEFPSRNLIKPVHYIVKVYVPSWFGIKSSSKLPEVESSRTSLASRTHCEVLGLEASSPRKLACPRLEASTIFEPLKFRWKMPETLRKISLNLFLGFLK